MILKSEKMTIEFKILGKLLHAAVGFKSLVLLSCVPTIAIPWMVTCQVLEGITFPPGDEMYSLQRASRIFWWSLLRSINSLCTSLFQLGAGVLCGRELSTIMLPQGESV